ncbi:hypothetical protein PtA15_10A683 [Puccinia triticina]|uniref:Uncharacterized protein n=1 Tax=Puccinia triticina TaxID=208348 RepID=A0ABY7CX98_9BASI|nr:uncharacterized protein PtA15_10A683 [Puccinia triticina]WAQ89259.1 hypothetical protein PtA15_10A683 [Puccinia triticina]
MSLVHQLRLTLFSSSLKLSVLTLVKAHLRIRLLCSSAFGSFAHPLNQLLKIILISINVFSLAKLETIGKLSRIQVEEEEI